jgi:hypothetical protein
LRIPFSHFLAVELEHSGLQYFRPQLNDLFRFFRRQLLYPDDWDEQARRLNSVLSNATGPPTSASKTRTKKSNRAVNGNYEILPRRAVTLGMHEMLQPKKFHCTFMRNWHAGLWRRAFLGPITLEFPGSLLQEHPNPTITMTELAAACAEANTDQATGEKT